MDNGLTDAFVDYVFKLIAEDKGIRADLRRADNPSFEWKVWPVIQQFIKDDIGIKGKRRAYALVAAAIAKSGMNENGNIGLGRAFHILEEEKGAVDPDNFPSRMARLLSCDSQEELEDVMRPVLSLMLSKGLRLDFKSLLDDLVYFNLRKDEVRIGWAKDYIGSTEEVDG